MPGYGATAAASTNSTTTTRGNESKSRMKHPSDMPTQRFERYKLETYIKFQWVNE